MGCVVAIRGNKEPRSEVLPHAPPPFLFHSFGFVFCFEKVSLWGFSKLVSPGPTASQVNRISEGESQASAVFHSSLVILTLS